MRDDIATAIGTRADPRIKTFQFPENIRPYGCGGRASVAMNQKMADILLTERKKQMAS